MTARSTILVVEANHSAREFYHRALTRAGYRVNAVGDGQEALRCLKRGAIPAAVVVDVTTPYSSSADFYKELRARNNTERIPVVAVIGADMPMDLQCGPSNIVRDHLYADAFVSVVEDALRHR